MKPIALGSDHAGYALKARLIDHLKSRGFETVDYGCGDVPRAEYPEYSEKVARAIQRGDSRLGVLVCGTGYGISLAANRVRGIRAVPCSEPYTAMLSRQHNDTNILCLGARVIGPEFAVMILNAWLDAEFQGGRHSERLALIDRIEP